jgi:dimethylargininase
MTAATLALTREVSPRIVECELTHLARTPIDFERARAQHAAYERALEQLGCRVERVAAAPDHPDSVFIEDTAVVVDDVAVITHPGAESRRREVDAVERALERYRPVVRITAPGTLDGGDVVVAGRRVFVGLTSRTNADGVAQLRAALAPFGFRTDAVKVTGCLHLKTAATALDDDTILLNPQWVDPAVFEPLRTVRVDPAEPMAANVVRVGDALLYADSYPRTQALLGAAGFKPIVVDASELAKAEGAVTCCSLVLRTDVVPLRARWDRTWNALRPAGDAAVRDLTAETRRLASHFEELLARHAEPQRHYHTGQHLAEVFAQWDRVKGHASRPAEAELALWYHDVVYDPQRSDNEALSAALARDAIIAAGLGLEVAARVETLILATRHESAPGPGDAALVVDVDLAILGERESRFEEYERQVREEYAWVPGFIYRRKRAEVLRRFLARPVIYSSAEMRAWGETRARANLGRSLARLG